MAISKRYAAKLEHRALELGLLPRSVDERTLAQRKWLASLRPTAPQAACDHGLFSDEAAQLDLVEMFQEPIDD
jgi:hypothetical protein